MLTALLLALLSAAASVLPERALYAAARAVAPLALPLAERRRQTVRNNLQRLQPSWDPPQLDAATKAVFQETAMYYVDTALLPRIRPRRLLERRLAVENLELLQEAVREKHGVVLAGAHLSNPEVAFQALAALDIRAMALVEPLADKRRLEAMRRRRESAGMQFVPATLDGVRRAVEFLREGGVVAVLADRDLTGTGVCVPFQRRLARFPTGAADLALRTKARLLVAYAVRTHDLHFRVVFTETPPLIRSDNRANDVRANVAELARLLETPLRAYCTQWRMFESPWAPCHDTVYHEGGAPRPVSGQPA